MQLDLSRTRLVVILGSDDLVSAGIDLHAISLRIYLMGALVISEVVTVEAKSLSC